MVSPGSTTGKKSEACSCRAGAAGRDDAGPSSFRCVRTSVRNIFSGWSRVWLGERPPAKAKKVLFHVGIKVGLEVGLKVNQVDWEGNLSRGARGRRAQN